MTKKKLFGTAVLIVLFVAITATAAYFYWQYSQVVKKNSTTEVTQLVTEIGEIMLLPNSLPTVATVTEKEKLEPQSFFKNAENGDKVLLYIEEKKAILYRPSIKKIIEVSPIQSDTTAQNQLEQTIANTTTDNAAETEQEAEPMPTIVLYNGTETPGITSSVEKSLSSLPFEFEVLEKENAQENTYEETRVFDISGKYSDKAEEIAKTLNVTVETELPSSEKKPNSDILIIVGKDRL